VTISLSDLPAVGTKIGSLISGGLDSCILTAWLIEQGYPVQPFYIRTGVQWEQAELHHTRNFLESIAQPGLAPLVELELPLQDLYGPHWSITGENIPNAATADEAVFLPGRNALLMIKAAVWCQLHQIQHLALAPLGSNPFPDATDDFFAAFTTTMRYSGEQRIDILRPFRDLHKPEVMQLGRYYPLELTFSCISPVAGQHCGHCNKCAERQLAFAHAGLKDITKYSTPRTEPIAGVPCGCGKHH
jgi:7-cyano-7-deazaguanine synthase